MNEIPGYQEMMLPVLKILADGKEHTLQQLTCEVADWLQLTEEQRTKSYSSGKQTIITHRTIWVSIYLDKAKLISKPKRGVMVITNEGKTLLQSSPETIDVAFLKDTYPEMATWLKDRVKSNDTKNSKESPIPRPNTERTPEEDIEDNYKFLRQNLAAELLEQIKAKPPGFFERLVVDLLLKMGYGGSHQDAGKVVGKSGDGGIDGLINEDKLGLDTIYIQAKRYDNPVPISHIRDFAGTLSGKKTKKGIFITTSSFPQTAYEFVKTIDGRIVLIDGEQLAELMIDNDLGVTTHYSYDIKRIDSDYFEDL